MAGNFLAPNYPEAGPPLNPLELLRGYQGLEQQGLGIQHQQMQNRLLNAQLAMGANYQQATNPDGTIDESKLVGLTALDPNTSMLTGEVAQGAYNRELIRQHVNQANAEATLTRLRARGTLLGAALANPTVDNVQQQIITAKNDGLLGEGQSGASAAAGLLTDFHRFIAGSSGKEQTKKIQDWVLKHQLEGQSIEQQILEAYGQMATLNTGQNQLLVREGPLAGIHEMGREPNQIPPGTLAGQHGYMRAVRGPDGSTQYVPEQTSLGGLLRSEGSPLGATRSPFLNVPGPLGAFMGQGGEEGAVPNLGAPVGETPSPGITTEGSPPPPQEEGTSLPGVQETGTGSVATGAPLGVPAWLHGVNTAGAQVFQNETREVSEARTAKSQLEGLADAAATFKSGPFAQQRYKALSILYGMSAISPTQLKEMSAYEEGHKLSINLHASFVRLLGANPTNEMFQSTGSGVPTFTLSQPGLRKLVGWFEGATDYKLAEGQAIQEASKTSGEAVMNAKNTWAQKSNPLFFIFRDLDPDSAREFAHNMGRAKFEKFESEWKQAYKEGYAPPLPTPEEEEIPK